jgi:hypothetical protein
LAAAGRRIYCSGGPRTRYPGKTPEALATYGVLGKKYTNDTFYGNKHIQIIRFLPARRLGWNSFKLSMIYGGMPNWLWSGCGFPRAVEEEEDVAASRGDQ